MHDGNLILLPKPLADEGTPIVINNACVSWRRLANSFTFSNARAYIGTLFPISALEAQEVVIRFVEKHFAKPLPAALWSAQRDVYGTNHRRPYVATGVYTQWLRARRQDVVAHLVSRLSRTLASWQQLLAAETQKDTPRYKVIEEAVAYYKQELAHFRDLNARHPTRHDESRARSGSAARGAEPEGDRWFFPARLRTRGDALAEKANPLARISS